MIACAVFDYVSENYIFFRVISDMDQDYTLDPSSYSWPHIRDNYLNTPCMGLAIILSVFLTALYFTFRDYSKKIVKRDRFEDSISSFSSKDRLLQAFATMQEEKKFSELKSQTHSPQKTLSDPSSIRLKSTIPLKERVRDKYLRSTKMSLLYQTQEQKREAKAKREREIEELNVKERRKQMEEQKAKEQQRIRQKEQREKEKAQKEKKLLQRKEKEKLKKQGDGEAAVEGNQPSEKSVRSGQRKTTIQMAVDQNEKKINQEDQPQSSKTFSLFGNPTANQAPSMLFPQDSAPAINKPAIAQASNPTQGTINRPMPSIVLDSNQPSAPKINIPPFGATQPSLFQNLQKPADNPSPSPSPAPAPSSIPNPPPQTSPPIQSNPLTPPQQASRPPPAALRQQITLTSEQYFEQLMKFADSQTATVQIPTLMANLGGAKSSLNDLLTFAQSFIDTITKTSDSELTTFSVKIYEGIVRQISTSNLKDGIYRIPPKSKTDQVEKNSINCYILYINLYRMMGYQKVWTIVFGKLLRMLEFIYKRKADLKKYTELELLVNKHLEKRGELQGKYLSRIDYLTYLLFGLTAFDPIQVFRQTEQKEPNVRESREKVESWGRQWNYKEFWMLTDLFLKNKHDSYFKPIVYMNILSALYPRIYANKQAPQRFRAESQVYRVILQQSKQYFIRFKGIPELKALRESDEGNGFEYDGDNFVQGIKVLEGRLTVEKFKEFNVKLGNNNANARDFQAKSNVFYYFSKEK